MSTQLTHFPADILAQVLINNGLGSDPTGTGAWPIRSAMEVSSPDNVITVYDTAGRQHGRTQPDGEIQEHYGIQVRVRATDPTTGRRKANDIRVFLSETLYNATVTIGTAQYVVHDSNGLGPVLSLGKDVSNTKRSLFTVNGTVPIRQVA